MSNSYKSSDIKVLSDIDHIRLRPGMYVGELTYPTQLLNEIIDNALDESQSGNNNMTEVHINSKDGVPVYRVRDYGRGIPIGKVKYEDHELESLQALYMKANSGAKFDSSVYRVRSGLHGVGGVCVCALSLDFKVTTNRDGQSVTLVTNQGRLLDLSYNETKQPNGVEVVFTPDPELFEVSYIPHDLIINRCKIAKSMGYPVRLWIDDEEVNIETNNILDLLPEESLSTYCEDIIKVTTDNGESLIVGFKYTNATNHRNYGYTNLLPNQYGGTHIDVVRESIMYCWDQYTKGDHVFQGKDTLMGLRAVIACFIDNAAFSSQTKDKLTVPQSRFKDLYQKFESELLKWMRKHKDLSDKLVERFNSYRRNLNSLEAQKEIMSKVKIAEIDTKSNTTRRGSSVVPKLIDCLSTKRDGTELFIVEGDSAAGCWSGSTLIRLANGTSMRIDELVDRVNRGESHYTYSCSGDGHISVNKITQGCLTKRNAKLIKVVLDNNEELICTPEHPFMLRDGSYKSAKDLTKSDSLMSEASSDHKILYIEDLDYTEDVYDITVPGYDNFLLDAGIFVHNSVARPRNKRTQAVLPLRGKIQNVSGMSIKDALTHSTVLDIVNSIGCGIGDASDSKKSRYERVIILTDSDPDGAHIVALILTGLINLVPNLVKDGLVYVVEAPLYGWWGKDGVKHYSLDFEDVNQEDFEAHRFLRYKGLGSLDDEDFKEACLNLDNRIMYRIEYPDDIEEFNYIAGTSEGRSELLSKYGVVIKNEK